MSVQIQVKNVSKIFGSKPKSVIPMIKEGLSKEEILKKTNHTVGVYDATFDIQKGEVFVIMGLSGSGKSTLIRCFNLLNKPTDGSILIDGQDITKCSRDELKKSVVKNCDGFPALWSLQPPDDFGKCRVWIRNSECPKRKTQGNCNAKY